MGDDPNSEIPGVDQGQPIYRQLSLLQVRAASDLGPVQDGISNAIRILARNGNVYVCKNRHLEFPSPYGIIADYICCKLAFCVGLNVPDTAKIVFGGEVWFGSHDTGGDPWLMSIPQSAIVNLKEVAGPITVMDVYSRNRDRRPGNLVLQPLRDTGGPTLYSAMPIDYAHALFVNDDNPLGSLAFRADPEWFIKKSPLPDLVTEAEQLDPTIDALESLPADTIRAVVSDVPGEWWPEGNPTSSRAQTIAFLQSRQGQLRTEVHLLFRRIYERGEA